MSESINEFSGELFPLLSKEKGDESNIICSPMSVSSVLAMVLAGAMGETAAQIRNTCKFNDQDDETFKDYKSECCLP